MAINQPTRGEIDHEVLKASQEIASGFRRVQALKAFLDATPDATLADAGVGGAQQYNYSAADVANLKTAVADLDTLRRVYEGATTVSAAKDFTTFLRRVWKFGL